MLGQRSRRWSLAASTVMPSTPGPPLFLRTCFHALLRFSRVILSPEEVARLLDAAQSSSPGGLKYRAALSVAYGAGLRASEVVSLKLPDIDSKRMVIRVEPGKGRKDRYAMLSETLLDLLRAWLAGGTTPVHPGPRLPPLRLLRRLPTEFAPLAQSRQASDNPSHKRSFAGALRPKSSHPMAAEGMQRSWRWNGGTISVNLEAIWEITDETIEEMQRYLDAFLLRYDTKRPHQGRNMNGRTPQDAFTDSLPKKRRAKGETDHRSRLTPPVRSGTCQVNTVSVPADEADLQQVPDSRTCELSCGARVVTLYI